MKSEQSESRFFMWRGVVAMAHADGVVTPQELSFINDYIADNDFSEEQLSVIGEDLKTPQIVSEMFIRITEEKDKKDFFSLARALSWCDGDFDKQEKIIIEQLEKDGFKEDHMRSLKESREDFNEVELCQNQWDFKQDTAKSLFGFLKKQKSAA